MHHMNSVAKEFFLHCFPQGLFFYNDKHFHYNFIEDIFVQSVIFGYSPSKTHLVFSLCPYSRSQPTLGGGC